MSRSEPPSVQLCSRIQPSQLGPQLFSPQEDRWWAPLYTTIHGDNYIIIIFVLYWYSMWLYINVYTHAIMIMWVMRFSIVTSDEPFPATKCTAVLPVLSFSVRTFTLCSSGSQLMSSFIDYNTWWQWCFILILSNEVHYNYCRWAPLGHPLYTCAPQSTLFS